MAPRKKPSAPTKGRGRKPAAKDGETVKPKKPKLIKPKAVPVLPNADAIDAESIIKEPPRGPGGRPSSYRSEFAEQARKLCEAGFTDKQLADFFDVNVGTIYAWTAKHPKFLNALKAGKDPADERVERSLYHRAIGYTFESEKIFQFQGEIVRTKTVEHVAPDTTACIFWLKNRRKDRWRDKLEHGLTDKDGNDVTPEYSLRDMARAVLDLLRSAQVEDEPDHFPT